MTPNLSSATQKGVGRFGFQPISMLLFSSQVVPLSGTMDHDRAHQAPPFDFQHYWSDADFLSVGSDPGINTASCRWEAGSIASATGEALLLCYTEPR